MSTLVGWCGAALGNIPPDFAMAAMLGARGKRSAERRSKAEAAFGLGVEGDTRECDLAADGPLWACMLGRPRWTSPDLSALAHDRGNALALIEAYRRHGERLFDWVRGAFSLALIDRNEQKSVLAGDRAGIYGLCYAQSSSGGLVFASRTDGVRAHPDVVSTVSPQSVFNFLYFGICPSPTTIYREQRKLLPAQYVVAQGDRLRTEFYWRMPYRESAAKPLSTLSRELMEHLRAAVERIVGGEDRAALGAFLSGGLDSSTVAGLLAQAVPGGAKTFTVGFAREAYDETHYAEVAARHFHTEQHTYYLTAKDAAGALEPLARAFDEPFGNSSVLPAYFCAKLARECGVQLLLAGDGGDELFAGNSRYLKELIFEPYRILPQALRRSLIEPLVLRVPALGKLPLARKARSYVQRAQIAMPDRLQAGNYYQRDDLSSVFRPEFLSKIDPDEPLANQREVYQRTQSRSTLQRMLHLDLKLTLADNDLRKVTTACELAELPVSFPFLDDDVVEFSAEVPPDLLIRRFQLRWFYKQAVQNFLHAETLRKRKHGFGMPYREWPREDAALREIAADCVSGLRGRGFFRADFLDQLASTSRTTDLDALVWDIIMLELWLRSREARTPGGEAPSR